MNMLLTGTSKQKKIAFLHSDKIKIQLVCYAAGNATILFKNKDIYEEFSKLIQIYYAKFGSILSLAITAVEKTNDFNRDNKLLYQKLEELKADMPSSSSLCPLPIMKLERYTGLPVVKYDTNYNDWVSEDVEHSRKYLKKHKFIKTFNDFFTENQTLAYVHIDGNNLGMKIANFKRTITNYEESLLSNKLIDENIRQIYGVAYKKSIEWFKELLVKDGVPKSKHHLYFMEINSGGDDINFAINPKYALKFVVHIMKKIANNKTSLFAGDYKEKNSTCAGIAYVSNHINFGDACDLAMQCCDNAKERAKLKCNLIGGQVGNWLDFQFFYDDNINDLDYIRRDSKSMDGAYNLMLRPYCIDKELKDYPCHFDNFERILKTILDGKLFKVDREQALDAIKQGKYEVDILIRTSMLTGLLKKKLSEHSVVKLPGDKNYYNFIYDVLEYCCLFL